MFKKKKQPQIKSMHNMSIKSINEEENVIEGYASTFGGEPDSYGDVIVQGAYSKTLQENGDRIKFLDGHDWNKTIGKVIEAREDNHGLYIRAKISDTQNGRDIMTLAKDGVIDRMSIGYVPIKWDFNDKGICFLKEIKLLEVSAVGLPANDNAVITSAKHGYNDNGNQEEDMVKLKNEIVADVLKALKEEGVVKATSVNEDEKEKSLKNISALVNKIKGI